MNRGKGGIQDGRIANGGLDIPAEPARIPFDLILEGGDPEIGLQQKKTDQGRSQDQDPLYPHGEPGVDATCLSVIRRTVATVVPKRAQPAPFSVALPG